MRCTLLLIVFFIEVNFGLAQEFRNGYIRLQGEDKVGLVGQIVGSRPESIEYKATDSAAVELYSASSIIGYGVNGIFYTAFLNPGDNIDWVFVDLLASGELTLLRRKGMYFIIQRGSNEFIHLDTRVGRTLNSLTSDCPWVATRAGGVGLDREKLTEFVNEYNVCIASKSPNLDGMQRTVSVALLAGFDYSGAKFVKKSDVETRFLSASKLKDKSFLQFGAEVTFKSYKISSIVGLYTGALYNSNSYYSLSRLTVKQWSEVNEYSIDFTELKIPVGLEFRLPSRKALSTYLRTGVIFAKTLAFKSSHPTYEVEPLSDGTVYYLEPVSIKSFKRNILFSGSVGVDYKVLKASYIRLQATAAVGSVDVTVMRNAREYLAPGNFSSFNFMVGFVF